MPSRRRKTPAEPVANPVVLAEASAATLAELLERAGRIRQTSDHLIEQMRDLASQIAEARGRAEDRASNRRGTDASPFHAPLERPRAEHAEQPEEQHYEEDRPQPDPGAPIGRPGEPAAEGAEDQEHEDDDE
jgi:hypothetical protein